MAIKITGYDRPPNPQYKTPEVIEKECSGEKTGCFLWDYEDDGNGNVKFKTKMLVRNDLSKTELPDVLEHERHHWSDFHRLAVALKAAVDGAVKAGKDPQVGDRLEWMLYDYCETAAAFHRRIGRMVFDMCRRPSSDRPK